MKKFALTALALAMASTSVMAEEMATEIKWTEAGSLYGIANVGMHITSYKYKADVPTLRDPLEKTNVGMAPAVMLGLGYQITPSFSLEALVGFVGSAKDETKVEVTGVPIVNTMDATMASEFKTKSLVSVFAKYEHDFGGAAKPYVKLGLTSTSTEIKSDFAYDTAPNVKLYESEVKGTSTSFSLALGMTARMMNNLQVMAEVAYLGSAKVKGVDPVSGAEIETDDKLSYVGVNAGLKYSF